MNSNARFPHFLHPARTGVAAPDLFGESFTSPLAMAGGGYYRVRASGPALIKVAVKAPADSGARYINEHADACGYCPPGRRVWIKRFGDTDRAGSVEFWTG